MSVREALKKIAWGYLIVTCSALHGLVLAAGYLAISKFKCLFENLQFNVTANPANPTEYELPIDVTLKDPEKCWVPLLVGTTVGLGVSTVGLTTYYLIQCKRARGEEQSSPLRTSPDHVIPLIDFPSGEHPEVFINK